MGGKQALDAFIAGIESLRTLNEQVAREAEEPVADVFRENARRGVTPDGDAWPEKADGGRALPKAADAVESSAQRNRITVKVGAPYVFHNWGAGGSSQTKEAKRRRKHAAKQREESGKKSKFHAPRRQMLPDAGADVPAAVSEVLKDTAARVFQDATKGGG
ncbi:hypothetical protein AKJ09_09852 [Labilithrix luteola]|uniref:Phage protein n=1 Tax=Labilithrix luteola TaxID=1391654 RepID=A0A0K1QBR0_9BACT|nr:hypothetical protein [Labilithrix luteola]AKV03189.1 hypothetical protein AKJ09_09852 [Labilithrix luteola]